MCDRRDRCLLFQRAPPHPRHPDDGGGGSLLRRPGSQGTPRQGAHRSRFPACVPGLAPCFRQDPARRHSGHRLPAGCSGRRRSGACQRGPCARRRQEHLLRPARRHARHLHRRRRDGPHREDHLAQPDGGADADRTRAGCRGRRTPGPRPLRLQHRSQSPVGLRPRPGTGTQDREQRRALELRHRHLHRPHLRHGRDRRLVRRGPDGRSGADRTRRPVAPGRIRGTRRPTRSGRTADRRRRVAADAYTGEKKT